uniref:Adult-specific cuticular protein ACP-20-like n=1 Tax=Diabrotica virgifera virgifera TaxID=50390 RepID=A0A6P7GMB8_DIAVI
MVARELIRCKPLSNLTLHKKLRHKGVMWNAPPKYEYKYAVEDPHTGDLKEQQESRIDDLTKSEYAVAEKDRKIQVSRIIGKSIPLVSKSISLGKY